VSVAKAKKAKAKARPPRVKGAAKPKNTSGLVPFKKGERTVGREKGTKNKLGVLIKQAITDALEASGRDGRGKDGAVGYFVWLSRAEPAVFGALVGKVLPMQIDVKDKSDHRYTPEEAIERLKERGLPVPPSLTSLAGAVGRAVIERENDEDYETELSGEEPEAKDPDEPEDIEDAA
jgi:hypothetical protein